MTAYAHLPYRRGVGIMLLNAAGQVFIAKRIDAIAEAWQMPQGGMDEGETPREAAIRELREETGVREAVLLAESADWYRYDLPDELVPIIWGGKYRGQEQKWFAMRLVGGDSAIDITGEHGAHAEFSEWRWAPMHTLPDVIVPFKRALYAALVAEFGYLID